MSMNSDKPDKKEIRELTSGTRRVLKEPILQKLQEGSTLSSAQLETLLIDLVVEDNFGSHITYDDKASYRSRSGTKSRGVTRGAFNRTLNQARRNVTRCLYTMLLLAYLGLFDSTVFRPFEVVAARIGDYRRIRDILAGKAELAQEDLESMLPVIEILNDNFHLFHGLVNLCKLFFTIQSFFGFSQLYTLLLKLSHLVFS